MLPDTSHTDKVLLKVPDSRSLSTYAFHCSSTTCKEKGMILTRLTCWGLHVPNAC